LVCAHSATAHGRFQIRRLSRIHPPSFLKSFANCSKVRTPVYYYIIWEKFSTFHPPLREDLVLLSFITVGRSGYSWVLIRQDQDSSELLSCSPPGADSSGTSSSKSRGTWIMRNAPNILSSIPSSKNTFPFHTPPNLSLMW